MTQNQRLLLVLRVSVEAGIVVALAYWGAHVGGSTLTKIVLGIGAPTVAFGVWGAVDFHRAGRFAEAVRLAEELAISLLAALALYTTGKHVLGIAFGALSVAYHVLVYASGERLLTTTRHPPTAAPAQAVEPITRR